MNESRRAFLAGERPGDVLMYFSADAVDGVDRLAEAGERTDDGVVLVVDGDQGRAAFQRAVGVDPMQFSQEAGTVRSTITSDCTGGTCPDATQEDTLEGDTTQEETAQGDASGTGSDEHAVRFLFAFVQEQTEDVGDIYGEGDVVHGYAQCTCGTAYSQRWVAGERE